MAADYGIPKYLWTSPTENILRASNLGGSDLFGYSVAISGNYAIIGAYQEDGTSDNIANCGAAYIFERDGSGNWNPNGILRADNLGANDQFGFSVAISGNYAIVGAPSEDSNQADTFNCGAAYIFERDGSGIWSQKPILRAGNVADPYFDTDVNFGYSVAISGDYAIVGAYQENAAWNINNSGAAYIFQRSSGNWIQMTMLRGSTTDSGDNFGSSVAISGDYAIVGAPGDDGPSNANSGSGAAYIYKRTGGSWGLASTFRPGNLPGPDRTVANFQFGCSVAISGKYAIVGVKGEDGPGNSAYYDFGAAYIYELNDSGSWIETPILRASNLFSTQYNYFGISVAISGNYAIVGAYQADGTQSSNCGAVYIFERNSSGNWIENNIIRASNLGANDEFGISVAIDGNYAIVGAHQEDGTSNNIANCGAAYIYTGILDNPNPTPLSFVGNTLTITNSITATDRDPVSFSLNAGSKLYPFRVTNFTGTGTITYTLAISGGSNVVSGTFSATNFDILKGSIITASGTTTYILTLTADAAITYTIIGRLLIPPANIISTPSSCLELKPIGTTIGTLTSNNLDNDLITYSVSDTANFSITGSTLKTNAIFDFETTPSYTVTITGLIGGVTSSNTITISVTNISAEATELRSQNLQGGALQTAIASQSNPPITVSSLKAAGYTLTELIQAGFTYPQLLTGYSYAEFNALGILPAWNIDIGANHLIKSYVKDFVDVSGMVVLRENANLYISGNAETAGNLSLNSVVVQADASFNRRIFVGGDVSMNGKVSMIGDLSMNGTVTKCNFNNSSIPKTAFSGAVLDGADYTTSRIVYDQTFQANDDVSMNGSTFASNNVKVSGNIVFGDGTVMNTYNNNILSTNPTVFNSSTFTALDICGNLVAGSYATSSDYRIKTNIVELDETYNVDKLRPVKYYQTQINREKYGLIAHELQEHYPDLVIGEKDGSDLQRVNYTGLIAILINDIKRMKQNLAELESGI